MHSGASHACTPRIASVVRSLNIAARLGLPGAQRLCARTCTLTRTTQSVGHSQARAVATMAYVPTVQLEQYEQQLGDKVASVRKRFEGWQMPEVQVRDAHNASVPAARRWRVCNAISLHRRWRAPCTLPVRPAECRKRGATTHITGEHVVTMVETGTRSSHIVTATVACRERLVASSASRPCVYHLHTVRKVGQAQAPPPVGVSEPAAALPVPMRVRRLARGRHVQLRHV